MRSTMSTPTHRIQEADAADHGLEQRLSAAGPSVVLRRIALVELNCTLPILANRVLIQPRADRRLMRSDRLALLSAIRAISSHGGPALLSTLIA